MSCLKTILDAGYRIQFVAPHHHNVIAELKSDNVNGKPVYMMSGITGDHSLNKATSDEDRVAAHWAGFVETTFSVHYHKPRVGARVRFGNATGRENTGKLIAIEPSRDCGPTAKVRWDDGGEVWCRYSDLRNE